MYSANKTTGISISKAALWEAAELFVLLFAMPLAVAYSPVRVPKFPVLFAGAFYCVFRLWGRVSFKELFRRPAAGWWIAPLARAAAACVALYLVQEFWIDGQRFSLIRERPWLWAMVMVLYPVLSVLPQEIIFRVFLCEGHAKLLNHPLARVLVGAILFGWAHIIYAGYFAAFSSFFAGIALALNYEKNRDAPGALWPLLLEHALYGQIVFTLGLGKFFFLTR